MYMLRTQSRIYHFNPNLDGLFRGWFWGRGGKGVVPRSSQFFFEKNRGFFGQNSTFTQSNSVKIVLEIF